ncbi:MAG TPA: hypothetical protein PLO08_07655, partial [Alicycliphilus sp.]|nr:hypothetical protein [Alicycliphilus sp.]
LAMMMMAIHRPRLVIVDAGRSFGLLLDYFRTMGLSTHSVTLSSEADVSLPPFVHANRLLDDADIMTSFDAAERQARINAGMPDAPVMDALLGDSDAAQPGAAMNPDTEQSEGDDDQAATDKRDLLGEMLIAAIMMITGGESSETARMGRADRYLISRAIIRAATRAREEGRPHPLAHDVAIELMGMHKDATLSGPRQIRAEEMGQSMMSFTQGLRGKLFNREGQDWPDADVTLVEMGTLTQDGYGDALAVAYTSLLDSVQSRGERFVAEDRPAHHLPHRRGPPDHDQRPARPEDCQGHEDVAQAEHLVLAGDAEPEGLPRQHGSRAVHVRILDATDHGQVGDRGGHALPNSDARAAQADGIGAQGAAQVHRRGDDFRDRPVPVQERAPGPADCPGHDRGPRKSPAQASHGAAWLHRDGGRHDGGA